MCHDQAKMVSARDFDGPRKPYEPGAAQQADVPVHQEKSDTIRRLEANCEQLRQANRALVEELDRVTDLKYKYAREAQIAKEFAKILTADMAPQL